jgi:hypothetical protein
MPPRMLRVISWLTAFIIASPSAFAMDGKSASRLRKAGVSPATIGLMASERTLETAAFSVEEIVNMKAAGIDEPTLQAIIREGSYLKDREPVVYGRDLRPLRLATAADIMELKRAGISDDVLRAIVYAAGRPEQDQEALRLLNEAGIWVERRNKPAGPPAPGPRR